MWTTPCASSGELKMRPQLGRPAWRRRRLEYLGMFLGYMGAFCVSGENIIIALVAMIVAMFILRATRPQPDEPPSDPRF